MDRGRSSCTGSPLPTRSPLPRIPLSPLFPPCPERLSSRRVMFSPQLPADAKNEGALSLPYTYAPFRGLFMASRLPGASVPAQFSVFTVRPSRYPLCFLHVARSAPKKGWGRGGYGSQLSVFSLGEENPGPTLENRGWGTQEEKRHGSKDPPLQERRRYAGLKTGATKRQRAA